MYSILLVDDEPLILSGIKFLLDWKKNDCHIIGTAHNGLDALEKIRALRPNIILCDINMPVMNGIDLLQAVSEEFPTIVFLMLTNLQDFSLVKDAMHYRAVDYIVKSQLEPDTLENCLVNAKNEWNNRNRLVSSNYVETQGAAMRELLLQEMFLRSYHSATVPKLSEALLQDPYFDAYGVLCLFLKYESGNDNQKELFTWEKDLINTLAGKHFPSYTLLEPEPGCYTKLLLHWSVPGSSDSYTRILRQFYQKVSTSSANITQVGIHMLATDCFHSIQVLPDCRTQLFSLFDYYYNTEKPFLVPEDLSFLDCQPLGISGISSYFADGLREKNLARCRALLSKVSSRLTDTYHDRSNAIWICNELYSTAHEVFHRSMPRFEFGDYFAKPEQTLQQLDQIYTRFQLNLWLQHLQTAVVSILEQSCCDKNTFVELAKQYVEDHLEEHISLVDTADYVNISPAYLSSLFKKRCGQSFVDYIHARKIDYACRLMQENKYLIYEISYKLGFNNAYYFTKIFKRHMGMTPMEYQAMNKFVDVIQKERYINFNADKTNTEEREITQT